MPRARATLRKSAPTAVGAACLLLHNAAEIWQYCGVRFAYDDQIASQPDALREVLGRLGDVPQLEAWRPILFAGIGTSLHACRIAAAWAAELTEGAVRPIAIDAHELALSTPLAAVDQVVVVTHRGAKTFPSSALARARVAGAATVAVVGQGAPPAAVAADHVVRTCPDERAATHTVSYVTALAALAKLVARMAGAAGAPLAAALTTVPEAIEKTLAMPAPVMPAERLMGREPILITGYGRDAVTADEAALKLKEGAYRWAEGMPIELALHGPPAALRKDMAAITITPAGDDAGRTATLRAFLGDMRITALTCGDADEDLPFYPVPPLVRPLVSIVPLQRLTAEVARKLGANPDRAHRESEPWGSAMVRHQL